MELQAIRYAARVSGIRLDQLSAAHSGYLGVDHANAQAALLAFLGWDSETDGALSEDVRIVLVSGNFSRELTTAVLWLNKQGLDITCSRLKPHRLGAEILVDIQQLIPLPEAADYETKLKAFLALQDRKAEIEAAFGEDLVWQDLPESRGCRISSEISGGWRTAEDAWPELQERLIDSMVRLERPMKPELARLP